MTRRARIAAGFACLLASIALAGVYAHGAVDGVVLLGALLLAAGVVLVIGGDDS